MTSPILQATVILGSVAALARAIDVKPPTVHQWISGKRPIPEGKCPDIERATHGKVRCEDLRPDLHWQRDPVTGDILGHFVPARKAA